MATALPFRVTTTGLVALAFSVYVIYLLEIVKLANPRVRRRDADDDEAVCLSV